MAHKKQVAILMGPTGSGKSALALEVAASVPAVIINADAMQMVSGLRILTARPTAQEEAQAEHALYGVLPPHEPTSVARWLNLVVPVIRRAWAEGKLPLLVGGTGMYVKALMEGIAKVPPIPEAIRNEIRALVPPPLGERLGGGHHCAPPVPNTAPPQPSPGGGGGIHALLAERDPRMAAQLKPGDTQRILRALEVMAATGQSLADWQRVNAPPLPEAVFRAFYIQVPRDVIYARIDRRLETMLAQGALDEVKALLALSIDAGTPIMRAHGVPELAQYLRGEITREAAVAKAQQKTRNYAKRQLTWIRNQMPDAVAITTSEQILDRLREA